METNDMYAINPKTGFYVDITSSRDALELARTCGYEDRHDWKTLEQAERAAQLVNERAGERVLLAVDRGTGVWPRFDVVRVPQVGDAVSRAFNGDSYPAGYVTRVSPSLKVVTTSTGDRFHRVKQSGTWRQYGTWSLTPGHVEKRNPHY